MENKTIGDEILDFRARHRISQREFASRAGVTLQTVYSIENGLQKPTKVTERKIRLVFEQEGE